MFDKAIIEKDSFLKISLSAKALYFLLGMEADDEGFVSPTRVLRLYGGEYGDIKNLVDTGLIIPFESGVVVITDWNQNNWLDSRRIRPTQYIEEKKLLLQNDNKSYSLSSGLAVAQPEENRREENRREEIAKSKKISIDKVDIKLSELLRDEIKRNMPTFKEPNIEMWANHVRLMREQDDRTEEQIDFIIKWAQKSDFWRPNILSTKKLREKFDTLVGQAKRDISISQAKKVKII